MVEEQKTEQTIKSMTERMTNIHNKTNKELIYELVISLNQGNCSYDYIADEASPRVDLALAQYDYMVKQSIITEK